MFLSRVLLNSIFTLPINLCLPQQTIGQRFNIVCMLLSTLSSKIIFFTSRGGEISEVPENVSQNCYQLAFVSQRHMGTWGNQEKIVLLQKQLRGIASVHERCLESLPFPAEGYTSWQYLTCNIPSVCTQNIKD